MIPKGIGALQPVHLRPWQQSIVRGVLAPGVRQALASMGRGNGKTGLAAMIAVYGLFEGIEGAQVLTVASDERQARHVWNAAKRMIQLNPELAERAQIFQDRIYCPHTDSTLAPLPAEPDALQGWDPTFCIVDELHVVTERVYDAMQLASGKREHSLILSISTAAGDKDGIMYRLTEHGRENADDQFYLAEFAAPDGCDIDDEAAWAKANPALGDFLSVDALRATLKTTRPDVFRRYRLNQWVGVVGSWLPWGLWDTRAVERTIHDREEVCLFFDGSASGDSTALVGCTLDGFVFLVNLWEHTGDQSWRVPRGDVDRVIDECFDRYDVLELACDPWGWRSEIETWAERHKRVIEWPTNVITRMAPATDRFYAAVVDGTVTHDGEPRMSAHMAHCVAVSTSHGDVIRKDRRGSPRKIDAAVGAIGAYDRAMFHANRPKRRVYVV